MKYLAVALHLASVYCAIDYQYQPKPEKPTPAQYCMNHGPAVRLPDGRVMRALGAAFPCAWIPMQVDV